MRTTLAVATVPLFFLSLVPAIATLPETPQKRLLTADALPLALDDHYQFRKTIEFLNDPKYIKPTTDEMIAFERQRVNYGALTSTVDRVEVRGAYYSFYWRAKRQGPVTVRFEYRQANLGAYVQAREVAYNDTKGTMETKFQVIGDDYIQEGRVISWRALLIADGKIVGLTQSYLWD